MEISHVPLILITYCNNFPHYQPSSPEQYICYSSSLHWYAVIIQSPQFIHLVLYSLCFCLVAKLCPTLCNPVDCNPPDSSVHGISQARTLEWVAMPFSRASSQPRDQTQVSCIAGRFLTTWTTSKPCTFYAVVSLLSHVQLFCNPMDCNPPDSSVHGISQARILEWVAISFSRGSSQGLSSKAFVT